MNSITKTKIELNGRDWLFVILCFALYFFWAVFFVDQYSYYGPDEAMRFIIPEYIVNHHSVPTGFEEELISEVWGITYAFDFKLPYLISALFMMIAAGLHSATAMIIASRLCSVLSGAGVALMAVIISKRVFGENPFRWVFCFLINLLPQIVFLSSYLNLDIFSLFTVMLILNSWLKCEEEDWKTRNMIELSAGLGLCMVSYYFAYGYLVGSFVLYLLWYIRNRETVSFLQFIKRGGLVLIIVFAISGWMLIRNGMLYDGDIFAVNVCSENAEKYAIEELKPSNRVTFKNLGLSPFYMLTHSDFIELSFRSFICVLGPMAIRGSVVMYGFYSVLIVIGLFGLIKSKLSDVNRNIAICGVLACAIVVCISVYYSWASDYEPQGRYIVTVAPMLFLGVTIGLQQLASKCRKFKNWPALLCACIALSEVEAFVDCLAFYSPNFQGILLLG